LPDCRYTYLFEQSVGEGYFSALRRIGIIESSSLHNTFFEAETLRLVASGLDFFSTVSS